ncbi:hypothetical protein, partial [Rhizobium undicola]
MATVRQLTRKRNGSALADRKAHPLSFLGPASYTSENRKPLFGPMAFFAHRMARKPETTFRSDGFFR